MKLNKTDKQKIIDFLQEKHKIQISQILELESLIEELKADDCSEEYWEFLYSMIFLFCMDEEEYLIDGGVIN